MKRPVEYLDLNPLTTRPARKSTREQMEKLAATAPKSRVRHEQIFHISVVQTLDLILPPGFIYWHTPNGETGKGKAKGGILQALGVMAGVHDILILGPDGRLHGLELKYGKNIATDAQKEFGGALEKRGCLWACCWSLVEVSEFIESLCRAYGMLPRGRVT